MCQSWRLARPSLIAFTQNWNAPSSARTLQVANDQVYSQGRCMRKHDEWDSMIFCTLWKKWKTVESRKINEINNYLQSCQCGNAISNLLQGVSARDYSLQEEKPPKQVCKAWFHQTQANNIKHQKSSANLQMCCKRTWKVCPKSSKKMKNMGKSCRRHVDVFALAMGDPGRARAKILAAEFVTSFCLSVTTSWSLPHGPYLQTDVMLWCCLASENF